MLVAISYRTVVSFGRSERNATYLIRLFLLALVDDGLLFLVVVDNLDGDLLQNGELWKI